MSRAHFWLSVVALGLFAANVQATAAVYNLFDDNSSITVNTGAGINTWTVDAVTHLETEWFWYRTAGMADEAAIHTLTFVNGGAADTNFDGNPDTAYVKYSGTGFTLELRASLDGGAAGSESSTLAEQITITNTAGNLAFHLFQYTDFNLGGTPNDDAIQIVNVLPDSVFQSDPKYDGDTVVVPAADYYEAGAAAALLAKLSDGVSTTLANVATAGPGSDVAWALQWDETIAPGKVFQVAVGKAITPEPATLGLLAAGFVATLTCRRAPRRKP